jgi:hypothetical protein
MNRASVAIESKTDQRESLVNYVCLIAWVFVRTAAKKIVLKVLCIVFNG